MEIETPPLSEAKPGPDFNRIDEKATDVNIKLYESARAELIQRIILRDSALLFYIAAVGSYLNYVITTHFSKPVEETDISHAVVIMIPLPFVCLVFSLIILQHHITIGRIGAFLRSELNWGLLQDKISRHWDNSSSFLGHANFLITLRLYAQGLILCLPLLYDVIFYMKFYHPCRIGWEWRAIIQLQLVVNMSVSLFIGWLHMNAHRKRRKDWKASE
jgi:hypothetical protein